jgi:hypothetical protein
VNGEKIHFLIIFYQVSGTVSRLSIPCCCRAIKLHSIMWCNLAVVWTVRPVVDMASSIADDGVGGGQGGSGLAFVGQ